MDGFVSAIITTYKRNIKLLRRAVNSVKNQTYKNMEIVIVDDNSEGDEYRKAIKEYVKSQKDIIYVEHKKNKGAQISRNDGIKNANGDFYAFLDDDDEWLPTKIEKQMKCFEDLQVGLSFCKGYEVFEETGEKIIYYNEKKFKSNPTIDDLLWRDFIGSTSQAVISKKCIDDVGLFDIKMPARQDYEMWIRISLKYKILGVDDYLFIHYTHSGEQITKDDNKSIKAKIRILNKYNSYYNKQKNVKYDMCHDIAIMLHSQNKQIRRLYYLLRCLLINPKKFYYNMKKRYSKNGK